MIHFGLISPQRPALSSNSFLALRFTSHGLWIHPFWHLIKIIFRGNQWYIIFYLFFFMGTNISLVVNLFIFIFNKLFMIVVFFLFCFSIQPYSFYIQIYLYLHQAEENIIEILLRIKLLMARKKKYFWILIKNYA